ncbi:hypothetical protein AAKU64_004421 [Undibacterium sp. GrIS 1.8]|uniref:hypothetical protein n=1 Tax=Undibacterium sp. GrIS 1.8 TaxID=3143934 RepID=UPI003396941C
MGRPTFKIDQYRLRALRREQRLTQVNIALNVHDFLEKQRPTQFNSFLNVHNSSENSDTVPDCRHYQRVESTGKTSSQYAAALASVLGVSVALLQAVDNPEPPAYLQYVQDLLKAQLNEGKNRALQDLLAHHAKMDEEFALESLAQDIAERIEHVLLVRNPALMADLTQLTGLSEMDLAAPANARGFWFLSVNSNTRDHTEVIHGAGDLSGRIGEIMTTYLKRDGDISVRMWHDKPWMRIEIDIPRAQDRMRIDFTRCQPEATGLRWIEAGWRDECHLLAAIFEHAYRTADAVTDFTKTTRPYDLHRLRLVVTEHNGEVRNPSRRMVVRGRIDDIPESIKQNFAKDFSSRELFVNRLTTGLRQALIPHLAAHVASRWYVRTVDALAVEITCEDPQFPGATCAELRYRITLVEEVGASTYDRVPVRQSDLEQLQQHIDKWLAEGARPTDDNESRPEFEPI